MPELPNCNNAKPPNLNLCPVYGYNIVCLCFQLTIFYNIHNLFGFISNSALKVSIVNTHYSFLWWWQTFVSFLSLIVLKLFRKLRKTRLKQPRPKISAVSTPVSHQFCYNTKRSANRIVVLCKTPFWLARSLRRHIITCFGSNFSFQLTTEKKSAIQNWKSTKVQSNDHKSDSVGRWSVWLWMLGRVRACPSRFVTMLLINPLISLQSTTMHYL